MNLEKIRIQRFRNFVDSQEIAIEPDVTALVGKNESGKTTILEALHRLNPANLRESEFELSTEYPRWRLSGDRKADPNIERGTRPIEAWFTFDDADLGALEKVFSVRPPAETTCYAATTYDNRWVLQLDCPLDVVIQAAVATADVDPEDAKLLAEADDPEEAKAIAKRTAKDLREQDQGARAKALGSFPAALDGYSFLTGDGMTTDEEVEGLRELIPRFFYFSDYDLLPGEHDLHDLAQKIEGEVALDPEEETFAALLSYANTSAADFIGEDYNIRKAELQASALGLTRKVFEYWRQNQDLEVEFDTELEEVGQRPDGEPIMHRILKILMRDLRHGGISTNFETRSAGFRWFFSFLAAFSRYQESAEPIVVLLDEPGTRRMARRRRTSSGSSLRSWARRSRSSTRPTRSTSWTRRSTKSCGPSRIDPRERTRTSASPSRTWMSRPIGTRSSRSKPRSATRSASISSWVPAAT
jgi:energy-coupling factor transporter ATP-binding protein EcfA2